MLPESCHSVMDLVTRFVRPVCVVWNIHQQQYHVILASLACLRQPMRPIRSASQRLSIQYPHNSPRLLRTHQQISIRAASTSSKSIG